MKILIHDTQSDTLEFYLRSIRAFGYKVGIAKDVDEIITMLNDDQFNIVLTNGGYRELHQKFDFHTKFPSTSVIGITGGPALNGDNDLKVDVSLKRPFGISKLWQSIEKLRATHSLGTKHNKIK